MTMIPECKIINETKYWLAINDQGISVLHRENGPAIERTDGNKFWYQNGELHRLDGPAAEYYTGYKVWYIQGKYISSSQKEFEKYLRLIIFR